MRVLLADPPAYTPPYDHALAAALARAGADVDAPHLTFPVRRGARADGYALDERLYPLSARMSARPRPACRQGGRASAHPRQACPARPTSCTSNGLPRPEARYLAAAQPRSARVHSPRSPTPADGATDADMEAPLRPLRARRRAQRERPRARLRRSASRKPSSVSSRTRSSARIRRGATTAVRCSRSA